MAKIPHALVMRSLKYGDRPDAEKEAVADELRGEDRRSEAILLFERRPDHPFLAEERRWAIQEGQAFHLLALRRMKVAVSEEDLRSCADVAESKGRWLDARNIWVLLEDKAALKRIAPHLGERQQPALGEDEADETTEDDEAT